MNSLRNALAAGVIAFANISVESHASDRQSISVNPNNIMLAQTDVTVIKVPQLLASPSPLDRSEETVATTSSQDKDPVIEGNEFDLQTVLTPTRLKQSLADVPASVTVITSDMITNYGIKSIPESLRLVPGMQVTQVGGSDWRINYHGTNILTPRRMNVLVDGMSVYRPGFARIDWEDLPVVIEDVDRIEVTRGPNSASYGANSMMAIINIITKQPRAVEGTTLSATVGTQKTVNGVSRFSGKIGEATTYRVTADHHEDAGFDFSSSFKLGHDSIKIDRLTFRSITEISPSQTFDLQATVIDEKRDVEYVDAGQKTLPDISSKDFYVNAIWKNNISDQHDIQVQSYFSRHTNDQGWTTCVPNAMLLPETTAMWAANKNYAKVILGGKVPSGGSASDNALAASAIAAIKRLGSKATALSCVNTDQNLVERRADIELQDIYVFSDQLRMVSGVGARNDYAYSYTYLSGGYSNLVLRAFTNVEYKPTAWSNFNIGGFLENSEIGGTSFSPRLAMNLHASEASTFRFVISKATRLPDIQEEYADWKYHTSNQPVGIFGSSTGVYYQTSKSPGNLKPERITSREIGYLGNFPAVGVVVDAKLFYDHLTDTISEKLQASDYNPTNKNWVILKGLETQITYEPSDRWMAQIGFSYLNNQSSTLLEKTQYAKNSGSIAISHLFDNDIRASLTYYAASADGPGQSSFGRQDITLMKSFTTGKNTVVTPSFTVRRLNDRGAIYPVDSVSYRQISLDSAIQYSFSLGVSF